ncbi:MAG: hypothetical protein L3J83_00015 [Proteobacteria bacterium]|nr:hypothetical protein [Pseudomonadota bacterium]
MKKLILLFLTLFSIWAFAQETNKSGNVQLPLNTYNTLINANKEPKDIAPAGYAIGQSSVSVKIKDTRDRTTALISLTTKIEIFEDKWTLVPILPYGAAITSARIDGKKIQLVQNAEWLSWSSKKAGTYNLQLRYTIDPQRSDMGYVLPLPIIRASSTEMTVDFPNQQVDMAIIPSSNIRFDKLKDMTHAIANIPATSSVLISWRVATDFPYVMSRAKYVGKLSDGVVTFSAKYDIELFTGESINIPLIANSVTLNDVLVDNKSATILERDGQFEVALQGRGRHSVVVKFQTQVIQEKGPPTISFPIPQVPVSEFNLQLVGKKDVSVFANSVANLMTNSIANSTSKVHVNNKINNDTTTATVFLPMAKSVSFSWVDAVPKDVRTQLRANANVYHAISAEEGVLYGQALIDYEITHGETSSLLFYLPSSAQVNRITSPTGGISDWNVEINELDPQEKVKTITVFLDRSIKENYQLQVYYEQLLQQTDDQQKEAINVPLIRAKNMHRQRGIVALLAGVELALKPIEELDINRVGENQLPAFFRNQISLTIAHTFKYTSQQPKLTVNTIAPERKQGKYNAQVDTLISLGEVTMRGSASIAMDVKSGAIVDLQLVLPQGINVLNVTGPSIRNHKIVAEESKQNQQLINIEFTQEMTGQFRIEVNYEKILGENISELTVPSVQVKGTEVQHGRIAVEALTAVEVQTAVANQLSSLEINELPQQLVLKTTNPILLAFKYVNTETPHELKLSMTRHQELDVQVAAIETANYQTLITNDGLSVTTATFRVRNSRRQFLRLNLPEDSEVWSVFVDGKAEKPALANDSGKSAILIKMLNSVTGFPVVVVYATPIAKMGLLGSISSQLPLPDMVVTHSFWDVFLPIGPNYQEIKSNMTSVIKGRLVNTDQQASVSSLDSMTKTPTGSLLNMQVPKQGIHYSFEKLYANKSDTLAGFEIRYASESGNLMGLLLSIVSVILIWLAIFLLKSGKTKQSIVIATLIIGILGLFVSVGYLRSSTTVPFSVALIGGILFIIVTFASKVIAKKN